MIRLPTTGAELEAWRLSRGWTMRELAARLGVNASTVSRAERRPEAHLGATLGAAVARYVRRARRPAAWSAPALRVAPGTELPDGA